ncbi:MAG: DUF2490 domain-containing protein [Prevotella sp.]|nr:DUF2490 domain-containing protein [Prevotella sp.]
MNNNRILMASLAIAFCQLTSTPARAQSDDFGIWTEANVEKSITDKLSIEGGAELRTRDDGFGEIDRWSVGVGASYDLTPWLKASVGYSLLNDHNHKVNNSGKKYADYWGFRHRLNVSLTASYKIGKLGISLRERWQYTYRPEKTVQRYWNYTDEDDDRYYGEEADTHVYKGKGTNKWRNRLQLKYKLSKQWRPFVSAETTVGGSGLDKIRYAAGTEWRISKQHELEMYYMYQQNKKDEDESNRHVIGVSYKYKF